MDIWGLTTTIVGTIVGAVVGATVGSVITFKLTARAKQGEAKAAEEARQAEFEAVRAEMPELIAEMKEGLQQEVGELVRECFVLPDRKCHVNFRKPRFRYYEDEHENLSGVFHILENHGYVVDVTPGNTPTYRMTEEFVELILQN